MDRAKSIYYSYMLGQHPPITKNKEIDLMHGLTELFFWQLNTDRCLEIADWTQTEQD